MRSAQVILLLSMIGCHDSAAPTTETTPTTSTHGSSEVATPEPSTSQVTTTSAVAPAEAVLPGVVVQLDRDVCYGMCPSYAITIFDDGRVEWEGRDFVATKGKKTSSVDGKTLEQIRKAFDDAKFLEMGDYAYDPATDPTDGPSYGVYYASGGRAHRLRHYAGSGRAPASLGPLEALIDTSVGSEKWIGTDAERSKMRGPAR